MKPKLFYALCTALLFSFVSVAQTGTYIKFETSLDGTGADFNMMKSMLSGSTLEVVTGSYRSHVSYKMGSMMTTTIDYNTENDEMLLLLSGMMGEMAFGGNANEFEEQGEDKADINITYTNETKKILSITCKKAISKDMEGNQSTYWYTEDIPLPKGLKQMPNNLPGISLEMQIAMQDGVQMTYTAVELKENVAMEDYRVIIPEGVEIQSFEDLQSMGMSQN